MVVPHLLYIPVEANNDVHPLDSVTHSQIVYYTLQYYESLLIGRTDATNLLDKGDVLVVKNDEIIRCQTSNFEISYFEIIVNEINKRTCSGGDYILPEKELFDTFAPTGLPVFDKDPLFDEVARLIVTSKTASTSIVQRRYNIGYNRAGKIMDQLEAAGIVGPSNGGKPRSVLVNSIMLESILNS